MPTTTEPQATTEELVLTPKLSPSWALSLWQLAFVGFWCVFFLLLNYLPLRNTDLWGHVAYGDWILEHGMLPQEDPFQPLAAGMKVIDSAWLSQLLFASVEQVGGHEALSALFALSTLATFLVLARVFFLQSRLLLVSFASVLIVLVVGWSRLTTIRPETFAALCFAALWWLVVGKRGPAQFARTTPQNEPVYAGPVPAGWCLWIGVPLLMALWANLHGSFICGLAVLACFFVGRTLEVAWQTRSWEAVISDSGVRRWLLLCELATLATLLNPYGIDLLLYTLLFSGNENLADVLEWQPLVILGVGGREFALSWVALMFVMRHSKQRIPVAHVLLLALFSVAVMNGVRMISWYAAVFGVVLAPHLAYLAKCYLPEAWTREERAPVLDSLPQEGFALPTGRRWTYSLVALLLAWIAVALAPLGRPLLGESPRRPDQVLDADTPLSVSTYLKAHPPVGQIFNPQWWGDWLVWDGPENLQPFVTTNMHVVPQQVWQDYRRILSAQPGWPRTLQRYRIDTVVLDKAKMPTLVRLFRQSGEWRISVEDDQAMLLTRRMDVDQSSRKADAAADEVEILEIQEPGANTKVLP